MKEESGGEGRGGRRGEERGGEERGGRRGKKVTFSETILNSAACPTEHSAGVLTSAHPHTSEVMSVGIATVLQLQLSSTPLPSPLLPPLLSTPLYSHSCSFPEALRGPRRPHTRWPPPPV